MTNTELQKRLNQKLRDQAKELGLKPLLYRIDSEEYKSNATVCLLLDNKSLAPKARGVAIQSPKDQPYHKVGANFAIGRALKAYIRGKNGSLILPYGAKPEFDKQGNAILRFPHLLALANFFTYKREFNPVPMNGEVELIEKIKKARG